MLLGGNRFNKDVQTKVEGTHWKRSPFASMNVAF